MRKSRLFVFTTKHVNPLLFGLTAKVSGVKLHSVKNVYVTPKKFTPDLQIFYSFPVFGLNVHVLGVKVPPKCNEKDNFHKALPNVKKTYVTLRKFTPDLKIFYTDLSAISVTLYNFVPRDLEWRLKMGPRIAHAGTSNGAAEGPRMARAGTLNGGTTTNAFQCCIKSGCHSRYSQKI